MADNEKTQTVQVTSIITIAIFLVGYTVAAVYWAATQTAVNEIQDTELRNLQEDFNREIERLEKRYDIELNTLLSELREEEDERKEAISSVRSVLNNYVSRTLTLEQENVEFNGWRENIETTRFTREQGSALEDRSTFEDQRLQAFIRAVCLEVERLYTDLEKSAGDDCRRP